jgi:hypothetical protein
MISVLTEANFSLFASQHYDNPSCVDEEEFKMDLLRFKYLKKLLSSYKAKGQLKERLVLNHLLVLYNIFTPHACTKMLTLKLEKYLDCVFPFIDTMGYLPEYISGIHNEGYVLVTKGVPMDAIVVAKVNKILREGSK